MNITHNIFQLINDVLDSALRGRKFWERRAEALWNRQGPGHYTNWTVGRTDICSYLMDEGYIHYAYPPNFDPENDIGVKRVKFLGSPCSALRKAVLFAEKKNREIEKGI